MYCSCFFSYRCQFTAPLKCIEKRMSVRYGQLNLTIWVIAVAVILATNYYRHSNTRMVADDIVASTEKYKSDTGGYPDSLERIGISVQQLRGRLGMSGYYINNGQTSLFYAVTYMVFDTYNYNFELKHWEHRSG